MGWRLKATIRVRRCVAEAWFNDPSGVYHRLVYDAARDLFTLDGEVIGGSESGTAAMHFIDAWVLAVHMARVTCSSRPRDAGELDKLDTLYYVLISRDLNEVAAEPGGGRCSCSDNTEVPGGAQGEDVLRSEQRGEREAGG